jgi:hypothetical protein
MIERDREMERERKREKEREGEKQAKTSLPVSQHSPDIRRINQSETRRFRPQKL